MDLPNELKTIMDEVEGQCIAWSAMQDSTLPYFITIVNEVDNFKTLNKSCVESKESEEVEYEEDIGVLSFFENSRKQLLMCHIEKIEKLISTLKTSL